ncbi:MAG TPA: radical SAM protein [Candidatus Woesearchaeota archaeon]|nr:radical SAM protein [Candidatus Woesearchaeota archaeon]
MNLTTASGKTTKFNKIKASPGFLMKIVLARPRYDTHVITPPLGLGYLASFLKKKGIECVVIDGLNEDLSNDKLTERIARERPDAVGISCVTFYYKETVMLSRKLKNIGLKCIIGGMHPSFCPFETLKEAKCDFVVCGEGELPLLELAKSDFSGKKRIKGVYFNSEELAENKGQPIEMANTVENLDELPFPDWKQINPNNYPFSPHGAFVKNFPVAPLLTSRGCPFDCSFCASPSFYNRRIRFRSPENVVAEIKLLVKYFGVREIHFEDDNLTLDRENAKRIFELMIKENVNVSWACPNGIRADKVDMELLRLMRRSGCYSVSFGIESGSDEILKKVKKKESLEIISKAISMSKKAGIEANGFFILGLPGETKKTINETISFAVNSGLDGAHFDALDMFPGCKLWNEVKGEELSTRWRKPPQWVPEGLSKNDLVKARRKAFLRFYLRPRIFMKTLKKIKLKQAYYIIKRSFDYKVL